MPQALQTFEQAVTAFDREQAARQIEIAERERAETLKRFPLEAWPTMSLEQYCAGSGLEGHVLLLDGVRGHPYLQHEGWLGTQAHHLPSEERQLVLRRHDLQQRGGSVGGRPVRVRGGIRPVQEGDWDAIDDIPAIASGSALRAKGAARVLPRRRLPLQLEGPHPLLPPPPEEPCGRGEWLGRRPIEPRAAGSAAKPATAQRVDWAGVHAVSLQLGQAEQGPPHRQDRTGPQGQVLG